MLKFSRFGRLSSTFLKCFDEFQQNNLILIEIFKVTKSEAKESN